MKQVAVCLLATVVACGGSKKADPDGNGGSGGRWTGPGAGGSGGMWTGPGAGGAGGGAAGSPGSAGGAAGGPAGSGGPTDGPVMPPDGPEACRDCGADQVCVDGRCMDLPSMCPCPVESYCDLATNRCRVGCTEDAQCSAGRYCDTAARQCRNGCREGQCGSNETCNLGSRVCQCITGFHRCGGACVREDTTSCGSTCSPCPTDPNGTASCAGGTCQLTCRDDFRLCGGACARCPTENATSFSCSGTQCVPSQCATGFHECAGSCTMEGLTSCGPSCGMCMDARQGACSNDACYGVVDFGLLARPTTCEERCRARGKTCAPVCNISYTRPNGGTPYMEIAGGHYTQEAAFQPWGYVGCTDTTPGGAPTSLRCCCTDQLTGPVMPGCTSHTQCGAAEFCVPSSQECFPTLDSRCPDGYTYRGQCSNGTQFCSHGELPAGTTFPFEEQCPAGTTERGGFYCSGLTRVCVPNM